MRNLESAVYNHLTADNSTTLYSLVGQRIWANEPQQSPAWTNNNAAIVFRVDGMRAHASAATITANVTFRCYSGQGNRLQNAQAVAGALFDVLHNKGAGSNGVMAAFLGGGGPLPPEPDTGYRSYLVNYTITFSNT